MNNKTPKNDGPPKKNPNVLALFLFGVGAGIFVGAAISEAIPRRKARLQLRF